MEMFNRHTLDLSKKVYMINIIKSFSRSHGHTTLRAISSWIENVVGGIILIRNTLLVC